MMDNLFLGKLFAHPFSREIALNRRPSLISLVSRKTAQSHTTIIYIVIRYTNQSAKYAIFARLIADLHKAIHKDNP